MSNSEMNKVYVSALICTDIVREKDTDLLTAVRITDGFTAAPAITLTPENSYGKPIVSGEKLIYAPIQCHAIFTFHSERMRSATLTVKAKRPNGTDMNGAIEASRFLQLGGGADGLTLNIKLSIAAETEGTHWIELYIDDELATKLPLTIVHGIQDTSRISFLKAKTEH